MSEFCSGQSPAAIVIKYDKIFKLIFLLKLQGQKVKTSK